MVFLLSPSSITLWQRSPDLHQIHFSNRQTTYTEICQGAFRNSLPHRLIYTQDLNCFYFGLYIPLSYTINCILLTFLHPVFFSRVLFTPPTIHSRSLLPCSTLVLHDTPPLPLSGLLTRPHSFFESLLCNNQCALEIFIWYMCRILLNKIKST